MEGLMIEQNTQIKHLLHRFYGAIKKFPCYWINEVHTVMLKLCDFYIEMEVPEH
jgi:hypothetical protein